jgi:hypothetical protein
LSLGLCLEALPWALLTLWWSCRLSQPPRAQFNLPCFNPYAWMCKYTFTSKADLVTGSGSPYGCGTSRSTRFLDNRLTDVNEVSLKHRPPFSLMSWSQGSCVVGTVRSIGKSNDPNGKWSSDLPMHITVPEPPTLLRGLCLVSRWICNVKDSFEVFVLTYLWFYNRTEILKSFLCSV